MSSFDLSLSFLDGWMEPCHLISIASQQHMKDSLLKTFLAATPDFGFVNDGAEDFLNVPWAILKVLVGNWGKLRFYIEGFIFTAAHVLNNTRSDQRRACPRRQQESQTQQQAQSPGQCLQGQTSQSLPWNGSESEPTSTS